MVTLTVVDDVLVVALEEKVLDARNAKAFRSEVESALNAHRQVVLDMGTLTFMDSSGLGALLSCLRQVTGHGGDMKICALTPQVRAIFQLVRMHRLFDIYNTREEAMKSFSA